MYGSPPGAVEAILAEELVITLALLAIVVPEATTKQRAEAVVENIVVTVTVVAVLCITLVADKTAFATGVLKEIDDTVWLCSWTQ